MQLRCNKCKHEWDEPLTSSAVMVQCPECYAVVPLVLAKNTPPPQEETQAAPKPAMPASQPRPSAQIGAEEQTTVLHPLPPQRPNAIPDNRPTARRPPAREADLDPDTTSTDTPRKLSSIFKSAPSGTLTPPGGSSVTPFEQTRIERDPSTVAHREKTQRPSTPSSGTEVTVHVEGETAADSLFEGGEERRRVESPARDFKKASAREVDLTGETIGGFVVKKMLGAGGMGAVCLARQLSLDRDIALKILPGKFAANPEFLMRFTREALSAAQLTHHNIIQVYDVGSDGDVHYISMEYVRGDNLGDMVRRDGKLQIDDAAGYVLQAARGLKYAHERGIVHRDIKPDNLMVNDQGIVKIADMGLAKMRGETERSSPAADPTLLRKAKGDLTLTQVAMGTPAYMPPEQARDAATVDHRADQYSLGCTLYYLCAGKAPYTGSSAMEIISKHMADPPPSLDEHVKNVPGSVSFILQKMLAKNPDDRYADMSEAIRDLESLLGVESEKGPYTPREHHLELLETEQKKYYAAPSLKKRAVAKIGFVFVTVAALVASIFAGQLSIAGGFLGLLLLTPLANFIYDGVRNKTYLFRRVRSVFFGMMLKEWAAVVIAVGMGVAVLIALNLALSWAVFAVLAVVLAAGYQFLVLRPLHAERQPALAAVMDMLKQLRLRGLSEDALHNFVCRFSGDHWEEFFEELFGYEAMILARGKWAAADRLRPRKKHAGWREPLARWLDGVEQHRKSERERRQLSKVEAKRLQAQGLTEKDAKQKADEAATRILNDIKIESQVLSKEGVRKKRVMHESQRSIFSVAFQGLRFLAGIALVAFYVVYYFANMLPDVVRPYLSFILNAPVPKEVLSSALSLYGLAAGAALLISGFSARWGAGLLVLLGAGCILGEGYLGSLISGVVGNADFSIVTVGLAFLGAGVLWSFLAKMTGKRF